MPRWLILTTILAAAACGPRPGDELGFVGAVIACERLEWARARHEMLQAADSAEASRYAADRCFVAEPARRVRVVEREARLLGQDWFLVTSMDGEPIEHHASAELREAIGQPARTQGWVRGPDLVPTR